MNSSDLVELRDFEEADKNFVYSTYLRGKYYGDFGGVKDIPKDIFMKNEHDVLEHVLERSTTKVTIACLKEDPSVIIGYSVASTSHPVLYWVFIKAAFRRIGIAKLLVPQPIKFTTCLTRLGASIAKQKGVIYDPYLL